MTTQNTWDVGQRWDCFSTGKNIVVRPGFQLTVVTVKPYLVDLADLLNCTQKDPKTSHNIHNVGPTKKLTYKLMMIYRPIQL